MDARTLAHRNPITPYDGRTLTGVVRRTWLRGEPVGDGAPQGRLLPAMTTDLPARPRLARARRQRRRGQRRVVRRAREPDPRRGADVPAAHVRAEGPDHGRLGDPPPPRAGLGPRDRAARAARRRAAASSSTPRSSSATSRPRRRSRRAAWTGIPAPPNSTRPSGRRSSRAPRLQGDTAHEFAVDGRTPMDARAADDLPGRRGRPAARARRAGAGSAAAHRRPSISPRWRTARRVLDCSNAFYSSPEQPDQARTRARRWATAGRPRGAATTATTGCELRLACAGRDRARRDRHHALRRQRSRLGHAHRRRTARTCCPAPRCSPTPGTGSRCPAPRPTRCAWTSIPTAAWPGCGSAASRTDDGAAGARPALPAARAARTAQADSPCCERVLRRLPAWIDAMRGSSPVPRRSRRLFATLRRRDDVVGRQRIRRRAGRAPADRRAVAAARGRARNRPASTTPRAGRTRRGERRVRAALRPRVPGLRDRQVRRRTARGVPRAPRQRPRRPNARVALGELAKIAPRIRLATS